MWAAWVPATAGSGYKPPRGATIPSNGYTTTGMPEMSTSFKDDFNEFDLLLEDDDAPVTRRAPGAATRVSPGRGRTPKAQADPVSTPKAARGSGRPSIRITPDWNRLAAVLFVVAVVLFLIYFAASSLISSRREGAYKDYFGEVRDVASQSSAQGDELNSILVDPNAGDRTERIARIEQLAARAEKLAKEAHAIDPPDRMIKAHAWFETALAYRAAGLNAVQRSLSASIEAKDQTSSAEAVAQAMARLVASDVLWADSFAVQARTVLKEDDVNGVAVSDSVFIKDLEALSPKGVASMLDRLAVSPAATGGKARKVPTDGKIRGGQVEGGQITVAPSGRTLALGGLTEIKGGDNITFEVPFTNQGEVQLTEVPVKITLRGKESDPVELRGVIERVDPGQTATAQVALDEMPNFGEVLDVDILVGPILGEKTADNNRASMQVQFTL